MRLFLRGMGALLLLGVLAEAWLSRQVILQLPWYVIAMAAVASASLLAYEVKPRWMAVAVDLGALAVVALGIRYL